MNRRFGIRHTAVAIGFFACLIGLSSGTSCPSGDPLNPTVPYGNRPPRIIITSVTTPQETAYFAQQGDVVTIAFTGEDGEDAAVARIFASLSSNPTPAQEIPILDGVTIGPGVGSGTASWNTTGVEVGTYYLFAEIDDRTYDATAGTGNPAVLATAPQPLIIGAVGTATEGGSPTVEVELPASDAGVTNGDALTIRYTVKDPNSDKNTLTMTYYFDTERNASSSTNVSVEVGQDSVPSGTVAPNTFVEVQTQITINLDTLPIRRDTDEGGRPLPYYVRVHADNGKNGTVDQYAIGAVRVLAAASDVVDLLQVGSTVSGATWQGFYGNPTDDARGSRAGSSFAKVGDMDGDGLGDFAIVSERASPYGQDGVGEVYLIYGRQRNVDPDAANSQYSQGRYAGVISLNSVGTFVPFSPTDPRYLSIFNIRGTIIPHMGVRPRGSLGISTVLGIPNITNLGLPTTDPNYDNTPELLIGSPYVDSINDQESDDPCRTCAFDEIDVSKMTCFTNATIATFNTTLENINTMSDGQTKSALVNYNLGKKRISDIVSFDVRVVGNVVPDTLTSTAGRFKCTIRVEDPTYGPSEYKTGPLPAGMYVTPKGCTSTPGDPNSPCTGGGAFDATISFTVLSPNFPVGEGQPLPPSIYDGYFRMYVTVQHDTPAPSGWSVEFTSVTLNVQAVTVDPEDHAIRFTYYSDDYPNPSSSGSGCDTEPFPADPLALSEKAPPSPPMNRSYDPMGYPSTRNYPDGFLCSNLDGVLYGSVGTYSDLYTGGMERDRYQTGEIFLCAGNDIALRLNEAGTYVGGGYRVANLSAFGQPYYLDQGGGGLRGARFRGAWYQPDRLMGSSFYDPTSMFGYTIDYMPNMVVWDYTPAELIASAPGSGSFAASGLIDLTSQLAGTYPDTSTIPETTKKVAVFSWDTNFSTIADAVVTVKGTATNLARIRISLNDADGNPIDSTAREMLLWRGASQPLNPDDAPSLSYSNFFGASGAAYSVAFDGASLATRALSLPLPRAALPYLMASSISLTLEIVGDRVISDSTFEITEVTIQADGLAVNFGAVTVIGGLDYSSTIVDAWCGGTNGDPETGEDRPMSWPSSNCTPDSPPTRSWCYPPDVVVFTGEKQGDALGWGHSAGDINADGVPDLMFGAPMSSNDPVNPDIVNCPPDPTLETSPLDKNGKVYVIYGNPTLSGGLPCGHERFEIRGSHADDQFGRVQGLVGDMNGDGYDDVFFAAEGYDADGIGGVPATGADAGFVGVLFGCKQCALDGQIAVTAEQVGTLNYPGCKFVGAAGARLGGGTPTQLMIPSALEGSRSIFERGQHGVAGAGDFNTDGFNDLLISAPGQIWPGARIAFTGSVLDGATVTINGTVFEFDTNGRTTAGRVAVPLSGSTALDAEKALLTAIAKQSADKINIASLKSQTIFPSPLPNYPTISFLSRKATGFSVSASSPNITVEQFTRLGVAYLIFGSDSLLTNKTFVLPDDLNKVVSGKRILKGIVFVSGYDQGDSEAPVEAVAGIGDVDGDGSPDIILGAPTADVINILVPSQRRKSAGEAYLIYGNQFGLNSGTKP